MPKGKSETVTYVETAAWKVLRVCLHADARNARSRAAIERLGATFEGILRSHRLAADFTARDSARSSILASEWPAVKALSPGCSTAPDQGTTVSTPSATRPFGTPLVSLSTITNHQ